MSARTCTSTLILLACVALFAYIGFASHISSMGYQLDGAALRLGELHEEKNDLIIELANTQNPTTVSEYTAVLDLVEMTQVSGYIDTRGENLGLNDR